MNDMRYLPIVRYVDGMAIVEDTDGTLYYQEIPQEYAAPGEALDRDDVRPVSTLPLPLIQNIIAAYHHCPPGKEGGAHGRI